MEKRDLTPIFIAASVVLAGCAQVAGCGRSPQVAAARTPAARPFPWRLPRGLPIPKVPSDNPMTREGVALGKMLFYDTRLSGNGTYACASCHQQAQRFIAATSSRVIRVAGSTAGASVRLTSVANTTP